MKTFVVLLLATISVSLVTSQDGYSASQLAEWNEFKATHGKTYDEAENARRLRIFTQTKSVIAEHNAKYAKGEVTYSMGINQFADLLPEEVPRGLKRH